MYKVVVSQLFTVVLQATSKLGTMARTASMRGALLPGYDALDSILVPLYWTFLSALIFNALYPSVLLHVSSVRRQRNTAAACDAALDLFYFVTFVVSCHLASAYRFTLPVTPYNYLATLYPLFHVYGVTRALERIATRWNQAAISYGAPKAQPIAARGQLRGSPTATRLPLAAATAASGSHRA